MAKGNFELLALENPLLDIQAYADEKLLEKYGLKANDAILAEEKHAPLFDELMNNYKATLIPGGAAQNTARGAAYILPEDSVVYIGCVGKDKYAETLERASKEQGVKVVYRYDDTTATGRCGVVITGHNRSLCTELGAANLYKLDHLKTPEVWANVENAKHFYLGGFHLTVCVPAMQAIAEHAAANNKTFALGLSAPFIPQFFKEPLDQLVPYTDYLIGNETEAAAYAESHDLKTTDIPTIAKHIATLPKVNKQRKRTVIITQGTEPSVAAVANDAGGADITEYPVLAIDQAQITDTNGAGDAFAGGFMAGLVQGKSLKEAISQGQWLAKLSIQELGPSFPQPKQTYSA